MNRFESVFTLLCVGCVSIVLAGCGGEPAALDRSVGAPLPSVVGAIALSNHYVEVTFARPTSKEAENPESYVITAPDLGRLDVHNARPGSDRTTVILTTDAQDTVVYDLTVANAAAPGSAGDEGTAANPKFTGSPGPEPYLASAIALDNTTILLTFSERMDKSTTRDTSFYQIEDPDGNRDIDIVITGASPTEDGTAVVLTTSAQQNIEYTVNVTNVRAHGNGFLIDPTRSSALFFGIPAVDTIPPRVIRADAVSATSVLVSFSEPVDNESDDPLNFRTVPDVVITDAKLSMFNTQILLAVLPLTADVDYTLLVSNVRDRAGNLMEGLACNDRSDNPGAHCETDADCPGGRCVVSLGTGVIRITPPGGPGQEGAGVPPRVVGAVSTGNRTILVTFSKPMGDSAAEAEHYEIVTTNMSPEAGVLLITDAILVDGNRTTVQLATLAQTEMNYKITAVNVRDLQGNHLAPRELFVDPSTAWFRGTPASCPLCDNGSPGIDGGGLCDTDADCDDDAPCDPGESDCEGACKLDCDLTDTDGDGLPDHVEQRGWAVNVELTTRDGRFDRTDSQDRDVTSNPLVVDTDGDGLDDAMERTLHTDPRGPDTDGDQISDEREYNVFFSSPTDQDSDDDELDDYVEVTLYKTSPILKDTDGDGLTDDDEVLDLNRDPRVADLPEWQIEIGDIRLQIDERYTYSDATGETVTEVSSTSTTLTQSQQQRFLRSDTETWRLGAEVNVGGKVGVEGGKPTVLVEGGLKVTGGYENVTQTDDESIVAAQEAYQSSLSKGREYTKTREVTRQVFGASIEVPLTVRLIGDMSFSITNLELSVLQMGRDRTKLVPIATLIPNATLATGVPTVLNIGPFVPERGPIILGSREVFPALVEELLREPRGPIIVPANFDIVDEFGRNFAFTSQVANDRTAAIIVDFGDGTVERFHVAVAGSIDDHGFVGVPGEFVGGFDGQGALRGIPLDYAFQDILGFDKNRTDPDSIVAGDDFMAETIAAGDDIQEVPPGTSGLDDREVIVSAGDNGELDTTPNPNSDDRLAVTLGYETTPTCNEHTTERIIEPLLDGDGIASTKAEGDDIQEAPLAVCIGPSGAGDECDPDLDCPGGTCTDDICEGGSNNGSDCDREVECNGAEDCIGANTCIGSTNRGQPCLLDSDCPGTEGCNSLRVSSGDLIVSAGPNKIIDTVQNGDDQRRGPGDVCDEASDCPGGAGVACDGREVIRRFGNSLTGDRNRFWVVYTDTEITAYLNGPVDSGTTVPIGADFGDVVLKPRMILLLAFEQDIDRDGLSARQEYSYGCSDRDKDSDDDNLGDFAEVRLGWLVEVVGEDPFKAFPDPRLADSDGDGVCDDIEKLCGTDPRKRDTDGDGVDDFDELNDDPANLGAEPSECEHDRHTVGDGFAARCSVSTPPPADPPVDLDPRNPDSDGDGLLDGIEPLLCDDGIEPSLCDEVDSCRCADPLNPDDAGMFLDTDDDGLTDAEETDGWDVTVTLCDEADDCLDTKRHTVTKTYFSDPTNGDTDFDGLPDYLERELGTDPTKADTDGDGLLDFHEFDNFEAYFPLNFQFDGFFLTDTNSQQIGTSLISQDTDGDGLSDNFERLGGWRVLAIEDPEPRDVNSSPLFEDSDIDGLTDRQEYVGKDNYPPGHDDDEGDATDPNNPDTDGDGRLDSREVEVGSNPLLPDIFVTLELTGILDLVGPRDGPSSDNEWVFYIKVETPTTDGIHTLITHQDMCYRSHCNTQCGESWVTGDWGSLITRGRGHVVSFTIPLGDPIVIRGWLGEDNHNPCRLSDVVQKAVVLSSDSLLDSGGFSLFTLQLGSSETTIRGLFQIDIEVD